MSLRSLLHGNKEHASMLLGSVSHALRLDPPELYREGYRHSHRSLHGIIVVLAVTPPILAP